MADLDIAPDLNKAPPHVEGDLLRQGSQSIFGRKSWKKYFFIVLKDKLNYYSKRDDYRLNKEPEAYIRMSQVMSITEAVFSGVPKKHHLNCGFTVEAFHPVSDQKVTLNLLAETPEDMRYWVFALRYIKAYHAKMKTRETVMNDEAERKILEKLLCMDSQDDEESVVWGDYSLNEEAGSSTGDDGPSGANVLVYFEDGYKAKIPMNSTDTTSDLLDKEEVKRQLTSSTAHLWLIDSLGNDMILKPDDRPALFPGKMQKLYALDHMHRVLPIFYTKKDFECVVVATSVTAGKILELHELTVQMDVEGMTNCGLFLKSDSGGEEMFDNSECPCELLFDEDMTTGVPVRQPVGKLMVRNKSLGGGRSMGGLTARSRKARTTVYKPNFRSMSEEQRIMEEEYEEEQAQSKALDLLWNKRSNQPATVPVIEGPSLTSSPRPMSEVEVNIDGEDWVVPTESKATTGSSSNTEKQLDSRGLEDTIIMEQANGGVGKKSATFSSMESRKRSSAVSEIAPKGRSRTADGGTKKDVKEGSSPLMSPRDRSPSGPRSKSPGRRLPDVPMLGDSDSPHSLRRRNATRSTVSPASSGSPSLSSGRSSSVKATASLRPKAHANSEPSSVPYSSTISVSASIPASLSGLTGSLSGKGPTIRFSEQESSTPPLCPSSPAVSSSSRWEGGPALTRMSRSPTRISRSPTIRASGVENLSVNSSRSSNFGRSAPTSHSTSAESQPLSFRAKEESTSLTTPTTMDEREEVDDTESTSEEPKEVLRPLVIDFKALQVTSQLTNAVSTEEMREEVTAADTATHEGKPLPINVTSPNLLKMILLQSSEAHDPTASAQPMDFIQLSGVALSNQKGVWSIQEGYNFHDELPPDCEDHTETFRLPGGICAIYNHTHKRWHVLPPSSSASVASGDNSMDDSSSSMGDHSQESQADKIAEASQTLYLSKKVLVTEVGSAFHKVVEMFGKTRDMPSKQKIGSDMMNPAIGHLIRGQFCSSLAALLLDGLRPYRLQGIIQDDIWKITNAFCNSAANDPSCALVSPSIEKLIFQPINALKSTMKDNNIKFRTFICLAMSRTMLTGWLEALPKQKAVLRKFYLPSSFLYLVSENSAYQKLYQQMLLTLEPMMYLPFDLSIDFESRHAVSRVSLSVEQQQPSKTSFINPSAEMEDGGREDLARAASPAPPSIAPADQSPSQVRSHVVIKTHAATGQRTTAGNVLNAVWDTSPLPSPSHSPTLSGPGTAKSTAVNEVDGTREAPVKSVESPPLDEERREEVNGRKAEEKRQQVAPEGTGDMKQTFKRFGGSLLKKVSDGFQQINRGGAITGGPPPKVKGEGQTPTKEASSTPPPPTPPVSTTGERVVEAKYTNICDDADELCFNKGDRLIVKEQINEEWLICSRGDKTGIVPMNYITPVS